MSIGELYDRLEGEPLAPVWISLVPREQALKRSGEVQGLPLQGMTFAIKDNIDYAGLPTTAACPAYAFEPARTAPVVQALEEIGRAHV